MYLAYSRIGVKSVAKSLIENFGSLNKVFNADLESLRSIDGVNNEAISAIFCVKRAFVRSEGEEINDLHIINN